MSRELTVNRNGPVVRIHEKEGSRFVGFIQEKSETKFGEAVTFLVEDGDAPIAIKDSNGTFVEVDVKAGDKVTVFAGGQLKDKLAMAKPGEKLEIIFKGKKLNPKSGRRFNDYVVNVLE